MSRRPAGIDIADPAAVPAWLARIRQMGESLKEALAHLEQPEHCTYCCADYDAATSKMCPVCHWFGQPGVIVVYGCRLTTVAEARQARGITDEEMR